MNSGFRRVEAITQFCKERVKADRLASGMVKYSVKSRHLDPYGGSKNTRLLSASVVSSMENLCTSMTSFCIGSTSVKSSTIQVGPLHELPTVFSHPDWFLELNISTADN